MIQEDTCMIREDKRIAWSTGNSVKPSSQLAWLTYTQQTQNYYEIQKKTGFKGYNL